MKNKLLKYVIHTIILILSFTFYFSPQLFAQPKIENIEKTEISGGAESNIMLQEAIRKGNVDMFRSLGQSNPPPPFSPTAITTIEGINFNEDATNGQYYHVPPDPIGAAGPNHVVSVVNTSIEWHTKAGVQQNSQRLGKNVTTAAGSFFASLTPLNGTFDPKVIYDQYNGRFVVVTLEQTTSPSNTSRILVAVSQTSDPNSGWYFTSINSTITIGTLSWADYPGLAVGNNAIYITANMFSFAGNSYTGGRLWIINKTPFYTGGTPTSIVRDHITLGSGYSGTYQPAHMFGNPPTGVGTFLVLYSGLSNGVTESVNVIQVSNSLTTPSFSGQDVPLLNIDNTGGPYNDAPQSGTGTLIRTNDRRTQNAVWRSNFLWTTFTVVPNSGTSAGQVTAHWLKIETTTLNSLIVSDQGNIGGEDIATGTYTFFPSIAVNSSGDAIIGFSASAPTIYPSAYYAGRYSTTPSGTVLASQLVKSGLDFYIRNFGSGNRWGDYSGASVDPSDDQSFYVFNEYALTQGTPAGIGLGRWGTVFGVVPVTALPVELSSFTAKVLRNGGVQLDWTTETEINNYGFEVERQVSSEELAAGNWEKIAFLEGYGNSNSPKEYSFIDRGITYGSFAYRLKQIDNDGTYEFSDVIEVNAGDIPDGFVLEQNYPNPFNPSTVIKFALEESQKATLTVYDILGKEIAQLFNENTEAGKIYEIEFDASGLSSGVYYYRLSTPQKSLVRKMLLLR
jgi:hypothetical protein